MSTEHKNGYRQPVNFTKLVKRAVFDTDFKSVILAQHPVKPGEPICESVFHNQAYLGVISVQDTKVLFYPPEQKR